MKFNFIMRTSRFFPLRHKILLLTGVVTLTALLLTVSTITVVNKYLYYELMRENANAQTETLLPSSAITLSFSDSQTANEDMLQSLQDVSNITAAILFDVQGIPFASYYRDKNTPHLAQRPADEATHSEGNQWIVQKAVMQKGKILGHLVLITNQDAFLTTLRITWQISILSMIVSFLVGFILFLWIETIITRPLHLLSNIISRVRSEHNYTLRVPVHSNDELAALTLGFNEMLEEIEQHEQRLANYNRDLERAVAQRTKDLAESVEKLRRARDKAEQANQAKSRFIANVSHELRTPLNAILGFADIIKNQSNDPLVRKYATIIEDSGRTLLGLINEILDLARIEAGKFKLEYSTMNLVNFIENMRNFFIQRVESKGLAFHLHIEENVPTVVIMDEVRLQQILINLIGNAVKFTEKGYIRMHVSAQQQAANSVQLRFEVEDTGIGIPKKEQTRIFRAFEQQEGQSQNHFGGTGLGLSIVKSILKLIHGHIEVRSAPGMGSCFCVLIEGVKVPSIHQAEQQAKGLNMENLQLIEFEPAHILIADHIPLNRELLRAYLNDSPFSMAEAGNEQEIYTLVEQHPPAGILINIKMSVEGIIHRLKNNPLTSAIPLIAITDQAMHTQQYHGLCQACLTKPITQTVLIRTLANLLPHRVLSSATPANSVETPPQEMAMSDALRQRMTAYHEIWLELNETSAINHIEQFATELLELTGEYHYPPLQIWAKTLLEQVTEFDIDNLYNTLKTFDHFINNTAK